MRQEKRIPIVLEFFKNNNKALIEFIGGIKNLKVKDFDWDDIQRNWERAGASDLRFGQLLWNMGMLEVDKNYYTEEDDWLIDKGYLNVEDIKFWGRNYTKDMVRLPETQYILLKDLTIDHMKAIIVYMGDRLAKPYLEYFNKRIKEEGNNG